jgi:hypothetical protein
MREFTPTRGCHTPWGAAQTVDPMLDGMWFVSTASHGGIKLSEERNAQVPDAMRRKGGWYEEDCEWAIPFVVFEAELLLQPDHPNAISTIEKGRHKDSLKAWNPSEYEAFYGVTLAPGESFVKDEQTMASRIQAGGMSIALKIGQPRHANDSALFGFANDLEWRGATRLLRKVWFTAADLDTLRSMGNTLVMPEVA